MQGSLGIPTARLNTSAAADYCGLASSTFAKFRVFGRGPKFLKLGRRVVYDVADLDAWLASNRRRSTSDRVETVARGEAA